MMYSSFCSKENPSGKVVLFLSECDIVFKKRKSERKKVGFEHSHETPIVCTPTKLYLEYIYPSYN